MFALIALLGCASQGKDVAGGEDSAGDDTAADTDEDAPCAAEVVSLSPADGALEVAVDTAIVATFSEAVASADIVVDGVSGEVTLAGDGRSASFAPTGGLDHGATYTVTASACESSLSAAFTTVGEALPVDLDGRTYDIELAGEDLTWVSPNLGSYLVAELQTDRILFMVERADTGTIDLVGAAGYLFRGETPSQYPCTYAIDFAPASFADHPRFAVGPLTAGLEASDIAFDLHDLTIAGSFSDDGEEANDVVVTGLLDVRPLATGLGLDICALAVSFGDSCVACPDGETGCLFLEVHDEAAPWREELVVDVNQDPTTDRYCD